MNSNNFFIKQNSTAPELKFSLTERLMEKYNITHEMMENVGITFSMIDVSNGTYRIANKPANLYIKDYDEYDLLDESKYTLLYNFTVKDTRKAGVYEGEFKLDFLGDEGCGKITLPNTNKIQIIIESSITKTTVI